MSLFARSVLVAMLTAGEMSAQASAARQGVLNPINLAAPGDAPPRAHKSKGVRRAARQAAKRRAVLRNRAMLKRSRR